MENTYKKWMLVHVIGLVIYLGWELFMILINFESNYPFSVYLLLQAFLSVTLWLLINKRLFIPAYYFACIIVILATYNLYTYSSQNNSLFSSEVNEIIKYLMYVATAFFALFLYVFLASYPNRVMKTARKLKLN